MLKSEADPSSFCQSFQSELGWKEMPLLHVWGATPSSSSVESISMALSTPPWSLSGAAESAVLRGKTQMGSTGELCIGESAWSCKRLQLGTDRKHNATRGLNKSLPSPSVLHVFFI